MRKVFQRELFHKSSLKTGLTVAAFAATGFVGAAVGAAFVDKLVEDYRAKNNVITVEAEPENVISPEEKEVIRQLREIVSHMDLAPEEIDKLCNEDGFPRAVFEPEPTIDAYAEITK